MAKSYTTKDEYGMQLIKEIEKASKKPEATIDNRRIEIKKPYEYEGKEFKSAAVMRQYITDHTEALNRHRELVCQARMAEQVELAKKGEIALLYKRAIKTLEGDRKYEVIIFKKDRLTVHGIREYRLGCFDLNKKWGEIEVMQREYIKLNIRGITKVKEAQVER